jgi:hypothetical protein
LKPVKVGLEAGPSTTPGVGNTRIVMDATEWEKMNENLGEIYRWIAEAMNQLNYYRNRK